MISVKNRLSKTHSHVANHGKSLTRGEYALPDQQEPAEQDATVSNSQLLID